MTNVTTLAIILFFSSLAYGTVYSWRASNGVVHYTNKEYEIPAHYRAKAKALYNEFGSTPPHGVQQTIQNIPPPPEAVEAVEAVDQAKVIEAPADGQVRARQHDNKRTGLYKRKGFID
ncbi:MAG: DUF4124 domain-containing protein [Desulfuromonadaceae bacterium]|nr:DUF4124 domain-containing protein [Desulfuromonadaceae bacterium]